MQKTILPVRSSLALLAVLATGALSAQTLRVTVANSSAPNALYDVLFNPAGTTLLNADGAAMVSDRSVAFISGASGGSGRRRRRLRRQRHRALRRTQRHAAAGRGEHLERRFGRGGTAASRWPVGGCRRQPVRRLEPAQPCALGAAARGDRAGRLPGSAAARCALRRTRSRLDRRYPDRVEQAAGGRSRGAGRPRHTRR